MTANEQPVSSAPEWSRDAGRPIAFTRVVIALVVVCTFLAYVGVLGFQFVYDDHALIVENSLLRSWRYLPSYFSGHLASRVYPNLPGNYYRPVLLLWLLINRTVFEFRPWGWHLSVLAVHLAVTLSVYFLAHRILRDELAAGAAAFVFGLHPVHVEDVAWAMGVTEPLVASLFIPSFLCYLNAREPGPKSRVWYPASLVLYSLALLAKETALALPMIVFAYEWVFLPQQSKLPAALSHVRRLRTAIASAAPYLALTAVYLVVRAVALKAVVHRITPLPYSTIIKTWPSVIGFYIRLLVWPFGLSAFYDTPYVTAIGFSNFLLPAVAVAAIALALWWWSRREPAVAFASAWMVLPILPALNFAVFPEGEIAHDRYLYLPSVGFSILVALALRRLRAGRWKFLGQPGAQVLLGLGLVGSLGFATSYQCTYWSNNLLLYIRGVAVAPHNSTARNNLANEMAYRGRYDEAIHLYQQVLAEKPNYWLANYNLGYTYYKLEKLQDSEACLLRAIALNPLDPDAHVYLGLAYLKMGRLDEAAASIRRALAIRPTGPGYHFALGMALKRKGSLPEALAEFKAELANDPQQKPAREQITELETRLRSNR